MFNKILVPLDGSKLAEHALSFAEEIALSCSGEVILISVTELISGQTFSPELKEAYRSSERADLQGPEPMVTITFGKMEKQAQRYLYRLVKGLEIKGVKASAEVRMGHPAEEIIKFAEESGADLIIISSHGRSGLSRWAHGSVADKVFRASCVPVLMVRAPGCVPGL